MINRRNFIQNGLLSSGSLLAAGSALSNTTPTEKGDPKPFQCNYGFHQGMFKEHAGERFIDQIKFGHSMGFRSIEDNGMMGRTKEEQKEIGDCLAKLGMTMGVFVLRFDNWPVKTSLTSGSKDWKDKFISTCHEAIDVAKRTHAKHITVVPGNYERTLPMGIQTANVIETLRKGAAILEPHGLIMVLEPLSDTPDLFLRYSDQTYMICKAVNSPSCKLLFDMYHMQRNEGDMIVNINRTWDEIAYFQVGDNPGRKEPGTGEVNYKNMFKHITSKGYKGVFGMEHGNALPGKEGEVALIQAYRDADSFVIK